MRRILLAILPSAMSCQFHWDLGRASVLFACEGTDRFSGSRSVSKGIDYTVTGWTNPEAVMNSGQCRATPTPT
ncbi:MAG: hypothetical protein KME43_17890 [Myxacorys chilensis ATA2-1-KO14]|nr:hypothetical protein [Myxacorys chilensis ATA2-1-KO14]